MRLLPFLAIFLASFNLTASKASPNDLGIEFLQNNIDLPTDPEWILLKDSLFTIEYPSSWDMNHTGQKGLSFVVISPLEGENDLFRENMSFVIQSMKADDSTLEDFVDDNTSQIIDMINESKIIKNEEKMHGKIKYREVVYTGIQNNVELINTQRYMFYKGDAYVFTFTRMANANSKLETDGVKIMDSLRLK